MVRPVAEPDDATFTVHRKPELYSVGSAHSPQAKRPLCLVAIFISPLLCKRCNQNSRSIGHSSEASARRISTYAFEYVAFGFSRNSRAVLVRKHAIALSPTSLGLARLPSPPIPDVIDG